MNLIITKINGPVRDVPLSPANKLLKKCNISISQVMLNDNFFYNKMSKILKDDEINQIGGDYKLTLEDGDYITLHDYKQNGKLFFAFNSKIVKDNIILEHTNGSFCILLIKEDNKIHISEFNVFGNYCLTANNNQLSGSDILVLILKFIEGIKEEYKINKITLIDKSELFCGNLSIPLGDFKILISGETWYGSYGFEPAVFKNGTYESSSIEKKKYKNNKKIIDELKIKDSHIEEIIKKYIIKNDNKKKLQSLNNLLEYVSKYPNVKLSSFIKEYLRKDKFSERCIGLAIIIEELFYKNNLISFNEKHFIKCI